MRRLCHRVWVLMRLVVAFALVLAQLHVPAHAVNVTFTNTASSGSYTVPAGVTRIQITSRGADGGLAASTYNPGAGATVVASYNVTPGTLVRFVVGKTGSPGDGEAGGGGGTGVFIDTTLVMVAGGGAGDDNTGHGRGGMATIDGSAGVGGSNGIGGTAGTGGNGGGGGNVGGTSPTVGDGGGGGGGVLSAGGNAISYASTLTTGGGQADTNLADGLSISPGGTSNQISDTSSGDDLGAAGGSGFGGGGAAAHKEGGGGGGYSGGGGAGRSGSAGSGGSYSNTGFAGFVAGTSVITAGGNGAGTGADGFVRISYTTIQISKVTINNIDTFSFTSPNMSTSPVTLTTTGTGAGNTVTSAVIPLVNFSTSTVITESAVTGFTVTGISCTGLNGGTATNNLGARTVTLNTTATAPGNDIACTFTNTFSGPALILVQAANTAGPVNVGQIITYTYQVTNPSTVTLSNVTVSDVHNGFGTDPVPGSPVLTDNAPTGNSPDSNASPLIWGTLAGGDVLTFSATYTVTQADIDNLQ